MTSRNLGWHVVLLIGSLAWAVGSTAPNAAPAQAPTTDVPSQIAAGKDLFATSCANCHGSNGKGAIGPSLVDRNLSLDVLRTTIREGRVGTPMPPFRDMLDTQAQAQVIAYAQWLSTGGRLPDAVITIDDSVGSASHPSSEPVVIGDARGFPARGAAIFFDPTRLDSCRDCHSFANKGGPVGPDLSTLSRQPAEIYRRISSAKIAAPGFPAVILVLRDGARLQGIRSEETADALVWFDVSSLPPVKRSTLKTQIEKIVPVVDHGIYDHTALAFSKQDRLDLSAYLGHESH